MSEDSKVQQPDVMAHWNSCKVKLCATCNAILDAELARHAPADVPRMEHSRIEVSSIACPCCHHRSHLMRPCSDFPDCTCRASRLTAILETAIAVYVRGSGGGREGDRIRDGWVKYLNGVLAPYITAEIASGRDGVAWEQKPYQPESHGSGLYDPSLRNEPLAISPSPASVPEGETRPTMTADVRYDTESDSDTCEHGEQFYNCDICEERARLAANTTTLAPRDSEEDHGNSRQK